MALDPNVWGPFYWFVLHTIAYTYPLHPNIVTKKKYYDLIQNLPLFLPVSDIGNTFSKFLNQYPVTPYLDSREAITKWMHFIHNKINVYLGLPEKTMADAMIEYYEYYKPKHVVLKEKFQKREKIVYICVILLTIILCAYLYS